MTGDKLLIGKLLKGDRAAFGELVACYQDRVFNTCLSLVQQTNDADDLAQDVFIRSFRIRSYLSR
ncbi:MAG: hypothetical protein IAF08_09125 [Rhizobacter sp.]|nr:hypothetical protein [Chlorobiales bacterium]